MGVSLAPGNPNYSSAGTNKFIPELWSGKLLVKFYPATVFGEIANTDYSGEIKDVGDKVHIRTRSSVTIRDYAKGQTLVHERLESPSVELNIDRAKYFDFICDNIDEHQSDLQLMDSWSDDAAEQMKIAIDTLVLGTIPADAHAKNKGTTAGVKSSSFNLGATGAPITITKVNILDFLIDLGSVLDEQNVPETGRWAVIPTWFAGMIKKSDLKDVSLTGDSVSPVRNGRIGMIDRFMLYVSNNLTTVTDGADTCYNVMFGHKSALTFAAQMTKMGTLEAESTFGTIVRGLNVFGFKILKAEAFGVLYAKKG